MDGVFHCIIIILRAHPHTPALFANSECPSDSYQDDEEEPKLGSAAW
jgi:hypothetical protein